MDKARILIVEDQAIVARDEQYTLEDLGYIVVGSTAMGEDAIAKAEAYQPDLVLMDIMLKGDMDGIEAAQQIRERFDIPVIFVTAYADSATLQRAKLIEPFGYILKPFEESDLRTNIEMALYKHKMDKRLKESERWLSATLRSIGDAVIATDAEGQVKFMNPVAEALTGWQQEEAVGKDLTQVFRTIETEAHSQAGQSLGDVKLRTLSADTFLLARDGTKIPIDDSGAPIKDDRGNVTGLVLVFRDITERRRVEEEREQLIEELDAFAHTVAHDLKNPLGIIIGSAEVLEHDYSSLPESTLRKFLRAIALKGRKMNDIVDELLLLAGARRMDIAPSALEMAPIVREALTRLSNMLRASQAEVIVPDTWPAVLGYAPWVEEVWVNYLSNAIKYGGRPNEGVPPRIELGFDMPSTGSAVGFIRFWVRDNGVGLSQDQRDKLFAPFERLGQMRIEGHGLGLSIVRRIVEKLGGQVGVDSTMGQGSLFYFTLPASLD